MFKLSQLRCFVAVAQELHFARAAKQLHIAQPAVSSQIKALEEWLGVRLLKRDARSVTLTSAGALFLAEAKLTLLQAQRAEAVAVQAARGQRSRIAVGYGSSVPFTGVLPGLLRPFIAEHPDLEVVLTELDPGQQVEGLKDRTIDFAMFPSGSVQRLPGIRTSPMLREGYDVVMSSGHPLAARESISMAELATETFIAIGRSTDDTPAWPLSGICGRTGFVPRIVHIVGQITTAISLAASGAGIAIVPHSSSQLNMFGAVYLPLEGDDHSTLEFAYRTNEGSRAILNLVDEARRYAAAMADRMTKEHYPTVGLSRHGKGCLIARASTRPERVPVLEPVIPAGVRNSRAAATTLWSRSKPLQTARRIWRFGTENSLLDFFGPIRTRRLMQFCP